jgi:prepilin-type N-terminal cleavage/methylation domain-containing protein
MRSNIKKNENGMTLVESMIAILILTVGLLTMAQVLAFSIMASKTHGRDAGKTTAAAQEKMEELVGLRFSDTTTDVRVSPSNLTGGTGLTAGGSVYPSDPVQGYADYIDLTGNRISDSDAAYTRQWQITNNSATLKTISVSVTSNKSFQYGTAPSTVLITQKAP